jgi:hypothetical protein
MNEQIRQLMEQAGLYDFVVESMGIDEELEKFAELIVRHCALTAGLMEHQGRTGIGAQLLDNFEIKD